MKSKKIPKVVLLYLGLIGFHIGSVFSVTTILILGSLTDNLTGILFYIIGWFSAVTLTWLLSWRQKETIETWIPFLKEKKKK